MDEKIQKARKRAKNDARTALRKLTQWAEEIRDDQSLRSLSEVSDLLDCVVSRLERKVSQ